jgi:hypothetical protein
MGYSGYSVKFESYSGVAARFSVHSDFLRNSLVSLLGMVDELVLELSRVLLVYRQVDAALDRARGRLEARLAVGLTVNILAFHTSQVASVAFSWSV